MSRVALKDLLIIFGGIVFFLALCATVGISTSSPPISSPAEAAYYRGYVPDEVPMGRVETQEPD